MDGPQKQFVSLKRRFFRLFSWVTGISLGSLIFIFVLALGVITIFVRTQTFQDGLRDKILQVAQTQLGASLSFRETEVSLFQLEPKIHFFDVQFEHKPTDTIAVVKRISVGISFLVSVPLLFFRQLKLSSIEVEGLSYQLDSLKTFDRWLSKLRPKKSLIPSTFQTSVGVLKFTNVELRVNLPQREVYGEGLKGRILLENFEIDLGLKEVAYGGKLSFYEVSTGSYGPFDGSLSVRDGVFDRQNINFKDLELRRGEDYLKISGELKKWDDPELNIEGQIKGDLSHFPKAWQVGGRLNSSFKLKGHWNKLEGSGAAQIADAKLKHKTWELAEGEWKLQYPLLELKGFRLKDLDESVELTGTVPLKAHQASKFQLKLKDAVLGDYLGLLSEHLIKWRGSTTGTFDLDGVMYPEVRAKFSSKLHAVGYQIRTPSTDFYSFGLPVVDVAAQGSLNGTSGEFTANVEVGDSRLGGGASWNKDKFNLQWDSVLIGEFGDLVGKKIKVDGSLQGTYGGPWSRMVLKAEPKFKLFQMNEQSFHNVKGHLILSDRILSGSPIISDEVSLIGGIYFPKTGPEQFYNLRLDGRNIDLQFLFDILNLKQSWIKSLHGNFAVQTSLKGPLGHPIGSGNIEVNDWSLREDRTKGRVAKAKWASASGDMYLDGVEMSLSENSEKIVGEMSFDPQGLVDLSLEGNKLKLGNLLYLFDQNIAVQGNADFSVDYSRNAPSLKSKMNFYNMSLFGISQKDSKASIEWLGDRLAYSVSLFGESLNLNGVTNQTSAARISKGSLNISKFNLSSLFRGVGSSRLEIPIAGSGNFEFIQDRPKANILVGLVNEIGRYSGQLSISEASIIKSGSVLQSLDPVVAKVSGSSFISPRLEFSLLRLRSQDRVFDAKGFFERKNLFNFDLRGELDLRAIAALYPPFSRCEGLASIQGSWDTNGFVGALNISDGMVTFQDSPLLIRNVESKIKSSGQNLELQEFRGDFREGSLSARGNLKLVAGAIESGQVDVSLNNTLLQISQGFQFRASGPLVLKMRKTEGDISGNLSIRDGLYRRRMDTKTDLFKALKPDRVDFRSAEDTSFWQMYKLNVHLQTEEPFAVRNNVAEGAANLNINVLGTLGDPRIRGSVSVVRGQFYYHNRQFIVRSGSIQFNDAASNIPTYDIRADTEIAEYRVFLQFLGDADNLKIKYSSDDASLVEKDIISLLSLGYRPSDPDIREQDPTRSASLAGIALATGGLQDRIESFSGEFGIQRFSILPAYYEQTGRTELQLTLGTDIVRNKLLLNYSNFLSASGGHKVELEYKLNRTVFLIGAWRSIEGESTDDFGGDMRFRFEFE